MKLPFTLEQFLQVFKDYNQSVYPLQIVFYLMAGAVILLSIKKILNADKVINAILSFFWLWMGIVYHLVYFTQINKAAYLFGGVFILQGLLFFYQGVLNNKLSYEFPFNKWGWTGAFLIIFALIIYPLLGYVAGHFYPASPTFGLPCPTTIFTIGILMWSNKKMPLSMMIIPLIWSIIGFFAALKLGFLEDTGLPVAGILGIIMMATSNKRLAHFNN